MSDDWKPRVFMNLADYDSEDEDELLTEAKKRRAVYIAVLRAMVRGVRSTKGLT